MPPRSRLRLAVALLLLAAPLFGQITKSTSARVSFVDRIRPADYAETELRFGELLSRTHSVVVLQTNAGQPLSALALGPQPDGTYLLTLRVPPAQPGAEWLTLTTPLDAAVARQVETAVAYTLSRNIMLAAAARRPPDHPESAYWIFQRVAGAPDAAGTISWTALRTSPDATRFTEELLGQLQRLFGADGPAREELLQRIDRVATELSLVQSRD